MNNLLQKIERKQIEKLTLKKSIPTFRPGDTLKVSLKISEGDRSRIQSFEGVCIARKNNSVNSKFTVRKISHGEGVERIFPLFSPSIDKIEVVRKGDVKRSKLYYLRNRTGKSARIADLDRGEEANEYNMSEDPVLKNNSDIEKDKSESSTEKVVEKISKEKENEPVEKKSESTASLADKTKDEKKS